MILVTLRHFSSTILKKSLTLVSARARSTIRSVGSTMAGGCGPSPPDGSESTAPKSCCPPKKVTQIAENTKSCCPPKVIASSAPDAVTRGDVSEYYGKTLTSQSDLLTSACVIGVSHSTTASSKFSSLLRPFPRTSYRTFLWYLPVIFVLIPCFSRV